MTDEALLPMYRVKVNKHDPSDIQWDCSEFAEWEVPALFKYIMEQTEMEYMMAFEADEDEEDE
jgi:hypothetical protein